MSMAGGFFGAFERRRGDVNRAESATIKPVRVAGFELTEGRGELTIDVEFPVWFTERPAMSFGGELDENDFVETGSYPSVSVVVIAFTRAQTERVGGGWYTGASLALVVGGKQAQRIWVHWQAEGKALKNPGAPSPDTGIL